MINECDRQFVEDFFDNEVEKSTKEQGSLSFHDYLVLLTLVTSKVCRDVVTVAIGMDKLTFADKLAEGVDLYLDGIDIEKTLSENYPKIRKAFNAFLRKNGLVEDKATPQSSVLSSANSYQDLNNGMQAELVCNSIALRLAIEQLSNLSGRKEAELIQAITIQAAKTTNSLDSETIKANIKAMDEAREKENAVE